MAYPTQNIYASDSRKQQMQFFASSSETQHSRDISQKQQISLDLQNVVANPGSAHRHSSAKHAFAQRGGHDNKGDFF